MTEQNDWRWTADANALQHTAYPAYQLHTVYPDDPHAPRRYVLVDVRNGASWEVDPAGASHTAGDIAARFVRTGEPTTAVRSLGVPRR
jgi:hypothetical protein